MISLGLRLSFKGGREATVRMIFTALGVGLGVALLCFAIAGFNGLKAKDVREGWYTTSAENRIPSVDESEADPLWWRVAYDRYDGDGIVRVDVAASGDDSPAPPGLLRVPAKGQYYVSPALAKLLDKTPAGELGDRFPGRQAGIIAESALSSPDSLVVIVGRSEADMRDVPGAAVVRSIETAPRQHTYTSFLKIVLGLGAIGLLIPVLVFVATSTRLAAARREERLAALRLVGATPRQVNVMGSIESGVGAGIGVLIGFALFWAFRPLVARIPFTGEAFFSSDLSLGWLALIGIAFGVPLAAVAVSLWSLRRVRISPLGVTRRVTPKPPRPRRLALLISGLCALALARYWDGQGTWAQWAILSCFAAIALGLVVAGPWLTLVGARLMARVARRDSTLIAGRRLADDPGKAFRAISGLILAVFIGTVFVGVVGTLIAQVGTWSPILLDGNVLTAGFDDADGHGLSSERADALLADLETISGVGAMVPVRAVTGGEGDKGDLGLVAIADWRRLGTTKAVQTASGAVVVDTDGLVYGEAGAKAAHPDLVPSDGLADTPVRLLLITTDGRSSTIERARTLIATAVPEVSSLITVAEVDEDGWSMVRMLQRMVDVGIIISLIIAGCSLAVSVAGSLIERKRPFSLLRLAGMPLAHLRKVVLLEAVVPLAMVVVVSIVSGLVAADFILRAAASTSGPISLRMPGLSYWGIVGGGLLAALGVVVMTMPLLARITEPQSSRME